MLHQTIKKVTEDIENFKLNTAIAQMMIFINTLQREQKNLDDGEFFTAASNFLLLLGPFAPHIGEELWRALGYKESIFLSTWPTFSPLIAQSALVSIAVQINGKTRDVLEIEQGVLKEQILDKAKCLPKITKWLNGTVIQKEIYIEGRIVNLVVE